MGSRPAERLEAYNLMNNLMKEGLGSESIVKEVVNQTQVPYGTVYSWYKYGSSPFWKGSLNKTKELFYVLGALLGDGCIYKWGKEHQIWLVGDQNFAKKYANKLSKVINRNVNAYPNRGKNVWFVKVSNIELYYLFSNTRDSYSKILDLADNQNRIKNYLEFVEGIFDAEGCVKVVKDSKRITPKICLDIANADFTLIKFTQKLMEKSLDFKPKISGQADRRENRKPMYHIRIYRKDFIKKFFQHIKTTKINQEKLGLLENWTK